MKSAGSAALIGTIAFFALMFFVVVPLGAQESTCPKISDPHQDVIGPLADACDPKIGCQKDLAGTYAVLPDIPTKKPDALLLISRNCYVTGIESSPAIFRSPVVEFWHDAWTAALARVPSHPTWLGLAINPLDGRTQARLHIHLTCVQPDVTHDLRDANITDTNWHHVTIHFWKDESDDETPHYVYENLTYNTRVTHSLSGTGSPFLLMKTLPGNPWEGHTLAVLGQSSGTTFYVLDNSVPSYGLRGTRKVAEDLLDPFCGTRAYAALSGSTSR